ncbi:MAG: bifunctional phosphopantothenoylcysteine decarboxylase/phosphopantothenate--cysteine ligase CoaBC [Bacteroidota bacterium]|nr:bifunctional phosphopantothenoylcysteine decarboxylase/phosphopantothenate--cysteine ligase CoaBC [Bacteroidota bacterium]
MLLKGKKILLGITGSIAAYKTPLLVRALVKEGADVHVIMTTSAQDFVTPLSLSTVSGHPVHYKPFEEFSGKWDSHVEMGNWADLMIIAPVSANTLSKMANAQPDNLLVATYLAAVCPIMFAPAMDLDMFYHPGTQKNIATLLEYGHIQIRPQKGELASGLVGCGRMEEPENILKRVIDFFAEKQRFFGKKVLVSAGPTYENIDPVRFIGNYSSGKMGFAIAEKFALQGADVTLVAGQVSIDIKHPNINRIDITSAAEMFDVCTKHFDDTDICVMSAAVADYTVTNPAKEKIKKKADNLNLELKSTKDILKELGRKKTDKQLLVGFALETENLIKNAQKKLQNKNLDFIVLNSANEKDSGFGVDTNKVTIITNSDKIIKFELKTKSEVAADILNIIAEKIN